MLKSPEEVTGPNPTVAVFPEKSPANNFVAAGAGSGSGQEAGRGGWGKDHLSASVQEEDQERSPAGLRHHGQEGRQGEEVRTCQSEGFDVDSNIAGFFLSLAMG